MLDNVKSNTVTIKPERVHNQQNPATTAQGMYITSTGNDMHGIALSMENSSPVFEICLPAEDPPWMKPAAVVSF